MEKAKKILALLLCAILLVGATIAGTVAYLTDTDEVQNTFTVGQVHIDLTETDTDNDSNTADNVTVNDVQRDKANAYKLMPGIAVKKDPIVTVKANSEDCYVRVKVTVTVPHWTNDNNLFGYGNKNLQEAFSEWGKDFHTNYFMNGDKEAYGFNCGNNAPWETAAPIVDVEHKTITYYLNYKTGTDDIVKTQTTDNALEAPFTYIYPSSNLTNAQMAALKDMTINVEAHAIQAEGFEDSAAAWQAFEDSQESNS